MFFGQACSVSRARLSRPPGLGERGGDLDLLYPTCCIGMLHQSSTCQGEKKVYTPSELMVRGLRGDLERRGERRDGEKEVRGLRGGVLPLGGEGERGRA